MKRLITLFFMLLMAAPVFGQFYSTKYRVPGQNWMELSSDHFRIIYPERYRAEALRSMAILEAEYDDIQNLVGGSLNRFPIILNPENDRSNGFVSPFNYRSEIELAPIRGKALSPRSGDWLESVLPHELVHALHFSVNPPALTRVIGLFSPDVRRSIHGAAPAGFLEGIAVQHESHGSIPGSGRGNYPYFNNQFNSLLGSNDEWSMGQLVHISDYTFPFNRHYIGGYHFTNWLQNTYGNDAFREAIDVHYKYPFLGFGVALKSVTGKWPGALYRDFTSDQLVSERQRLSSIGDDTDSKSTEIPFNSTCRRMLRPSWIGNETVLFYGRSCNRPSGFYTYQTETGNLDLLHEVVLTENSEYVLAPDRNDLLYSRYHADTLYDNVFRGDIHRMDTATGSSKRLTKNLRLFSPGYDGENLYAAQTEGQRQVLVRVDPVSGNLLQRFDSDSAASVMDIEVNPSTPELLALIGRKNGVQALWFHRTDTDIEGPLFEDDPDIAFDGGSVFDLHWHPDGDRLLFVSDYTGTMNIYEYHTTSGQVSRLTRSLYNAFEPAYSPDGSRIAYVSQEENDQVVKILRLDHALNETVPVNQYRSVPGLLRRSLMNRESIPDSISGNWTTSGFITGLSWLIPKIWIPSIEQSNNDETRYNVTLEGTNLMSTRSYSMEATVYRNRFWYDLTYRHKGFYPGYQLELFNQPFLSTFRIVQDDQEFLRTFLQQSRGAALKIPFRFRLESNARFSSITVEPQYFLSQIRFLDPISPYTAYSRFGTRHTLGLRTALSYRLRQFVRDLQPNSGWVFFTETRYGLNDRELPVTTREFNVTANLTDRRGFRGGISTYLAPLRRWNQSLRITAQVISQTDVPVFNTSSLFTDSFPIEALGDANNISVIDTRYTIPLTYPDDGGVLLPVYLSNLYLVLFHQTLTDLDSASFQEGSRAVYGAGIRSRFRLSNLAFDVGISIGWEPTRDRLTFQAGSF
jgi:hypothetical protein